MCHIIHFGTRGMLARVFLAVVVLEAVVPRADAHRDGIALVLSPTLLRSGGQQEKAAFIEAPIAQVQALLVTTSRAVVGLQMMFREERELHSPDTVSALGLPLLKRLPEVKCNMCGALSAVLTTDTLQKAHCCAQCGNYS
mmetsp:Transcript_41091/g.66178  ORF Transcript_41091/g.66178 Transcript_41091/m.66178 type:complete len:140 (+) Transcript_41091:229-648(+)